MRWTACINPNLPSLHPGIINYIMQKMAGLALYFFQKRVGEVSLSADSSTSRKMRENPKFYTDWLYPKVRQYYNYRGWEMGEVPSLIAMAPDTSLEAPDAGTHSICAHEAQIEA